MILFSFATEATSESRPLAENGSDSESDDEVGAQAPPLTKQISNILNRYPEGGQILKVLIVPPDTCMLVIFLFASLLHWYIFHASKDSKTIAV